MRDVKVQRATDFAQSTAIPAGPAQSGAGARVVRSLDDLDQLAAVWDALAGGAGSPMQQFIWARAGEDGPSDRRPYPCEGRPTQNARPKARLFKA